MIAQTIIIKILNFFHVTISHITFYKKDLARSKKSTTFAAHNLQLYRLYAPTLPTSR